MATKSHFSPPATTSRKRKSQSLTTASSTTASSVSNKRKQSHPVNDEPQHDPDTSFIEIPGVSGDCFNIVEFKVGRREKQTFTITRNILCQHSQYFATVASTYKDQYRITSESTEAFAILHRWLYTQQVIDNDGRRDYEVRPPLLSEVKALGDKLRIPDLVEQVKEALASGVD